VIGEELTGNDYFSQPLLELSNHPDFDPEIYAFVGLVSKMTTARLQTLMERNDANG
jgi:hypothetical protein